MSFSLYISPSRGFQSAVGLADRVICGVRLKAVADDGTRPVKTFNTAVVYYHKFRLQHSDGEYSFVVSPFISKTVRTVLSI